MDRVSVLLGHSSIKVTERHYLPWVRARQEQLEADVRQTWGVVRSNRATTSERGLQQEVQ
jgi:integrase